MLEFIRSNAQSWAVKIAFGIIIIVFIFWGVGSLGDGGAPGAVVVVGGKPISFMEAHQAVRQAEEAFRRENPAVAAEQMREMGLPRQAIQQLVFEAALAQEAARLGLTVTPAQLRRAIEKMPVFQNGEGKFDAEAYKRILGAQGGSLSRFEASVRKSLLEENLRRDVAAAAWVSPEEARAFFNFAQEQRDVEYVFFPAADYKPQPPAADEIRAWYESNLPLFAVPAKADVEYVSARPADLVKPESIAADAVRDWYAKNTSSYALPERVQVRHILLRLTPDAPQADVDKARKTLERVAGEARKSGNFAALAARYSEDAGTAANGGDLGWIEPGQTTPAFNDAAFALKEGELSEPVRTEFGLHLIKADKREPARTRSLTEAEGEIRRTLAEIQGGEKLRDGMEDLIAANILGKPLQDAAAPLGLTAKRSGPLSAPELEKLLGIKAKDAQTLMAVPAGAPLDTALETKDNGIVVIRVAASVPAATRPLAEVSGEIAKTLMEQKARTAALEAASAVRKAMGAGASPPAARAKTVAKVGRTGPMPVLGDQPELLAALFSAEPLEWLPSAFAVDVNGAPGAVLARARAVVAPDDAQWRMFAELVRASLETQRKNQMFNAFMGILMSKTEVLIKDSRALQELERL